MTGKRCGRGVGLGSAIVEQVERARLVDYPRAGTQRQVREAPVGALRGGSHHIGGMARSGSGAHVGTAVPDRPSGSTENLERLAVLVSRIRVGEHHGRVVSALQQLHAHRSRPLGDSLHRQKSKAGSATARPPGSTAVTSDEAAGGHVASATIDRPRSGAVARRLDEQATGVLHGPGSPQFPPVHGTAGHGIDGNEQHEQPPHPKRASENTGDADNRTAGRGVENDGRRKRHPCRAGDVPPRPW